MVERFTAEIMIDLFTALDPSSSHGVVNGIAHLSLLRGARDVYVTIIRECTGIHIWDILAALILPMSLGS